MALRMFFAITLLCAAPVVFGADDKADIASQDPSSSPTDLRDPDEVVTRFINEKDWRKERAIQEELVAMGDRAVHSLDRQAKRHEDAVVRLRCFKVLTEHYAKQAEETIAHDGLSDADADVRYHCAWSAGDLKIYGAHRRLRLLMEDAKQAEYIRQAATKSLAQLGEPDVIRQLVDMLANDRYMPRYMASIGIKALTGKDLGDVVGYDYGEGAFVSGGVEARTVNEHPASYHEEVAKRHQAIADYCLWLEKEKPEAFKHLYSPY